MNGFAVRSSSFSKPGINPYTCALSGRSCPAGGIMPARNFLTIFSHSLRWSATFDKFRSSIERFPFLALLLWHSMQYSSKIACCAATAFAAGAATGCAVRCGVWPDTARTIEKAVPAIKPSPRNLLFMSRTTSIFYL